MNLVSMVSWAVACAGEQASLLASGTSGVLVSEGHALGLDP